MRTRLLIIVAVTALASCDPGYFLRVQQPVPRRPTPDCVRQALEQGSRAMWYQGAADTPGRIRVAVADSASGMGSRGLLVDIIQDRDGSLALRAEYMWLGTEAHLPPDEQRTIAALAAAVVEQIRAVCVPDAPRAATCHLEGRRARGRPCSD